MNGGSVDEGAFNFIIGRWVRKVFVGWIVGSFVGPSVGDDERAARSGGIKMAVGAA